MNNKTLENFNSSADFQNYINDNNIKTPDELKAKNLKLYERLYELNLQHDVKFPEFIDNQYYSTLDRIQEFIFEKEIISKTDFKNRYIMIYRRMNKLLSEDESRVIIFSESILESSHESRAYNKLKENGIYLLIQIPFGGFRYDLVDTVNKIIVEVHGRMHFNKALIKEAYHDDYDIEEKDRLKKHRAEDFGYTVLYFTYYTKEYEEFGYFDYVITDEDELVRKVKALQKKEFTLGMKVRTVRLKFSEYTDVELMKSRIQKYIDENQIKSPWTLCNTREGKRYSRIMYSLGLRDKINFINDKPYDPAKIKSPDDINKIILEEKIECKKQLEDSKYSGLYGMARYHGWIDQLVFYRDESKPIRSLDLTLKDVNKFLKENKIKTASEFSKANSKYYAKSVRAGWLSLLEYYEDYPFEVTQNITLERLNKYILENKFKDWEEFCKSLTNRRSVVGKIHRESWKDKLTYYSEEQDLQE